MNSLSVVHLTKQYVTRAEPLEVLRDATWEMSGGESLAILGPSGSGKSTLLQILGTLDRPTSGTYRLNGQSPWELDETALAAFRNHSVGFVFQDHCLLPQLSVLENTLLPSLASGRPTSVIIERARELIERIGLSNRTDHRPGELSGGEKQRVAIARALLMRPILILADEPTGNLDQVTADGIAELLCELQVQADGDPSILIVVTHSDRLAGTMQRRIRLVDGRTVEEAG